MLKPPPRAEPDEEDEEEEEEERWEPEAPEESWLPDKELAPVALDEVRMDDMAEVDMAAEVMPCGL